MKKIQLFYFTGTGNSLFAAKELAKRIDAELIPISSVIKQDKITVDSDAFGVIFPIHYMANDGLPLIIKRFMSKLPDINSKYFFAVATSGGGVGPLENLEKLTIKQNGILAGGFIIHMPSNVMPTNIENNITLFNNSEKKLDYISNYINKKQKGKIENIPFLAKIIFAPFSGVFKSYIIKKMQKQACSKSSDFDTLTQNADKSFKVNDKCDGCGICAKICPVENIVIENGKPLWMHHCSTCLACYNWCPKEAVITEIVKEDLKYTNPRIGISEMYRI